MRPRNFARPCLPQQKSPQISLFQDDIFELTSERVLRRNEAMVLRDITSLIVPSAEGLFSYGAKQPEHLFEEMNVSWSKCFPTANGPIPQPDYSAGFKSTAFIPMSNSKDSNYMLVIGRTRISWQRNGCTCHFSLTR